MDPNDSVRVLFNVPHVIPLTTYISTYFFLTGISAASFLISTLAYVFGMEKFKPAGRIGAVVAPIVLMIAPLFLVIDLEQPLRFFHLFYMFNFRSPVTWGTFLLTLYPINCLVYLFFIYKAEGATALDVSKDKDGAFKLQPVAGGSQIADVKITKTNSNRKWMKFFGSLGIPLAILVHGYTGFIVGLGQGRAMWNVSLMPMYFLVSAMVSGTAFLILLCILRQKVLGNSVAVLKYFPTIANDVVYDLSKILAGFIVLDFLFVVSEVLVLTSSRPDDYAAAMLILQGSFAPLFVGVEIILGLFAPLLILAMPRINQSRVALSAASILVLVGVYAMRYVTVVGGQMIPLN
ncbi:MAG: polysulfide reductase NrfD [Chloroflexi bacterium]|nr:polysulfide reductase NrfD [Chloroflexota bacterium]